MEPGKGLFNYLPVFTLTAISFFLASSAFERSFRIPTGVKADKIDATFDKGVLKVTVPKAEEAKKKEIAVKVKTGK